MSFGAQEKQAALPVPRVKTEKTALLAGRCGVAFLLGFTLAGARVRLTGAPFGVALAASAGSGLLGVCALSRRRKVSFWALVDMTIPSLLLGQAIGRWGNFFNQEAYGNPVLSPAFQFFPLAVLVNGAWYQATFFYESMWDLLGFLILWGTRKRWRHLQRKQTWRKMKRSPGPGSPKRCTFRRTKPD